MTDLQEFGAPALTVAFVALMRQQLSLTQRGSLLFGAVSAFLITVAWGLYAHSLVWAEVPVLALQAWLMAMGAWSGGKALAGR